MRKSEIERERERWMQNAYLVFALLLLNNCTRAKMVCCIFNEPFIYLFIYLIVLFFVHSLLLFECIFTSLSTSSIHSWCFFFFFIHLPPVCCWFSFWLVMMMMIIIIELCMFYVRITIFLFLLLWRFSYFIACFVCLHQIRFTLHERKKKPNIVSIFFFSHRCVNKFQKFWVQISNCTSYANWHQWKWMMLMIWLFSVANLIFHFAFP